MTTAPRGSVASGLEALREWKLILLLTLTTAVIGLLSAMPLAADGLHPEASRVSSSGVTDGPFSEAKELVGGYWIIQAKDLAEATEWARRCPAHPDGRLEIRQIRDLEDYTDEVQALLEEA